ncbi:Gfo/Idh/MocA family oxidoreductase [Mesobacillus foraminis]|uniref:Gfo/Idh/MocA family protein n=1 Tax=Mesobacillus foraminis TaxID=279826 RepID=UPI001BEBEF9E|nr:Gfo/Idh/MocA family oxidoreductase [Mesobacillus foraminis]MBT2755642.1 Gfo/Idh/MocA family oxidoreductase [Mesobacillus foraminis]
MEKIKIGIIGCGNISGIYLQSPKILEILDIVAVADLDLERAKAKSAEYNIAKAYSVEELLADPEIELVINLTIPGAHAEICLAALEAGKHVYVEKPLSIHLDDGRKLMETAEKKGLRVGCAPDTFLGGGLQTCRKLIDDGWIGEPTAATAFMMSNGPEGWHPDPEFFYKKGGGPMFDMGPYYLTAMIHLLGPIRRVTGSTRSSLTERTILSQPKYKQKIKVETPTHIAGVIDFESGAIGSLITSFDVFGGSQLPRIEVYGTQGTLVVPDPNTFGGPIYLRRAGEQNWTELPFTHGFTENSRGIGVADMAFAIKNNRSHRASGELAFHVLEAMHAFHLSSDEGRHYEMTSGCERPAPFPVGINKNSMEVLD